MTLQDYLRTVRERSDSTATDQTSENPAPPARRRRRRRIAVIVGMVVLLLAVAGGVTAYVFSASLGDHVGRVPGVFEPLPPDSRPVQGTAENFLVVGTDNGAPEATSGADVQPGSQRSDLIMLLQLAPDKKSATVVSLPSNAWVDVPGRTKSQINSSYAVGGPTLLVQTVEQLTQVRIDHFAVIDFAGFQDMVDAVGGIDVTVAQTTSDRGVTFQKGVNHLDGPDALVYVRQNRGLPGGDLDRTHRQQNALKALLAKAASSGILGDPVGLYRLLDATSRSVAVDDTLSNGALWGLALNSTGLRPTAITFLNAPIARFGREGNQPVGYLDTARSDELWAAMRSGTTGDYVASHPGDKLSAAPA